MDELIFKYSKGDVFVFDEIPPKVSYKITRKIIMLDYKSREIAGYMTDMFVDDIIVTHNRRVTEKSLTKGEVQ